MSKKIKSWWKKQPITMRSAIVSALIGGIFVIVSVLLPNKPDPTVVLIDPVLDNSKTPIPPPFTPALSTKVTPLVITPYRGDVDAELLVAWENAQLAPNTENNTIDMLERSDSEIILQVEVVDNATSGIDWKISSKKLALELLAAHTSSLFESQEAAKDFFIRGSIEQAYFDDERKALTIRFVIHLKEE